MTPPDGPPRPGDPDRTDGRTDATRDPLDTTRGGPRRYVPVPGIVGPDDVPDDEPCEHPAQASAPSPTSPSGGPVLEPRAQPSASPPAAGLQSSARPLQPSEPGAEASEHTPEPSDARPARGSEPSPGPAASPPDAASTGLIPPDVALGPVDASAETVSEGSRPVTPASGQTPQPSIPAPKGSVPASEASAVVEMAKEATRNRGRELAALVMRYGRAHLPQPAPRPPAVDDGPPRLVGRVGQLIPYLQTVPWILGAVFVGSFFWDFDGASAEVFGRVLPLDGLLRVLSVSGLIGFGTNWLAITMLFQPRAKRAIIPQGLIPAQRERVIYRLSDAISRELINADIIKQKIQESGVIGRYRDLALGVVRGVVEDAGFRSDLKALATDYAQEVLGSEAVRRQVAALAVQKVEEQAGQGLGGVALRLYRTFAEDDFQRRVDAAIAELPQAVPPLLDRVDAALDSVPARVEAHADEIEEAATKAVLSFVEGLDVRALIMEKARGFDESQLENLLKSTSNEQLNYIKYLGAILGVFGGFVIWQPIGALVVFGAIGLALWGLDEALVRARIAREGR